MNKDDLALVTKMPKGGIASYEIIQRWPSTNAGKIVQETF